MSSSICLSSCRGIQLNLEILENDVGNASDDVILKLFRLLVIGMNIEAAKIEGKGLPSVSKSRISYIAKKLDEKLRGPGPFELTIASIYILVLQMKQYVQQEGLSLGLLQPIMKAQIDRHEDPRLSDARKIFADTKYFLKIIDESSEEKMPSRKKRGFKQILNGLKSTEIGEQSLEFDRTIMELVDGYGFHNNFFVVFTSSIQNEFVLEVYGEQYVLLVVPALDLHHPFRKEFVLVELDMSNVNEVLSLFPFGLQQVLL